MSDRSASAYMRELVERLIRRDDSLDAFEIHATALELIEELRRARMAGSDAALEDITRLERDLGEMTEARDTACNFLERTIDELAAHEDDPSMMDGHRLHLAACRKVGVK